MFGSGNPTPYDIPLIVLLVALAILLSIAAATSGLVAANDGERRPPTSRSRRGPE
jgi:hypothetical protein